MRVYMSVRVYTSALVLLNMWVWACGGWAFGKSRGQAVAKSAAGFRLSPTAHLFRSRGHIYTRTACHTYMHTHRMRDIFTSIHTLRRYIHTLRGGGAEDVWRQELRCIYGVWRGEGHVCWVYCVPTYGKLRCMYGVSRAKVYVCARHTVHRRMYVLGILCTNEWRGAVYVWCMERLSVCMCSPCR